MDSPSTSTEQTVRLSFFWVLVACLAMFGIGFLGGVSALHFFGPPNVPLPTTGDNIITPIQEVTISPNTATSELVTQYSRSVVLLGQADGSTTTPIGTGFVVTNDGLLATTATLPPRGVQAFDWEGREVAVTVVGTDQVFGVTYLRAENAISVPLDLRQSSAQVGELLLALSQNPTSHQPFVSDFRLEAFALPEDTTVPGMQRVLTGSPLPTTEFVGSPVLDDEGRVVGIVADTTDGTLLPVDLLRTSIDRIIATQREYNPFTEWGFAVRYNFLPPVGDTGPRFVATVTGVTSASPASEADMHVGDHLIGVGETALTWDTSLVSLLPPELPTTIQVMREDEERTISLQPSS